MLQAIAWVQCTYHTEHIREAAALEAQGEYPTSGWTCHDTAIVETPLSSPGKEKKIKWGSGDAWGVPGASWAFRDTMGHVGGARQGREIAPDAPLD